ncbi:MAG: endopeptidase La [Firmicutes bacterium]|nr:endopeptidase La [Bacillota bacterium]
MKEKNTNALQVISEEIVMPVIALRGMVMFPNMVLHFDIGRKKSVLALEEAMRSGQNVFVVAQKDVKIDDPEPKDVYGVGVIAKVRQIINQPGDIARALVEGGQRGSILVFEEVKPFMKAKVKGLDEVTVKKNINSKALERKTKSMFVEYLNLSPKISPDLIIAVHAIKELGQLADFMVSNIPLDFEEKQKILEELDEGRRLKMMAVYLAKELDILKIENDLAIQLKSNIDQRQKEYFLREQMKVISEELGEEDDPRSEANKYLKKLKSLKLSKANFERLSEEIEHFARTPFASSESSMLRSYIDLSLSLPWNKLSKENRDIGKAEEILNKEHFGLENVKEHMIEFLSASILSKKTNSQILCLVGPPGVGKTSVAESLARAVGRKCFKISLGGIRDEAEIRGHRKTYVGAMPGRIILSIKRVNTRNPLIVLDEIDKISKDYHGDPAAALLEVLDPEQNKMFSDNFLNLDFDLSEVFFVATANDKSQISQPLIDRMEIIDLYSYTHEEKFNIAKKYLVPKQLKKNGLNFKSFEIKDLCLRSLIDFYTREAGVRELERKISSLMRKAAKLIVVGKEKKVKINEKNLEKMLGPKKFKKDVSKNKGEIGVVRGLAWTAVGGETMPIEVSLMKGKGKVQITGSLGNIMKESAKLAVSYIRSNSEKLGIQNDFYNTMDIHIHAPEGAVPKDGPSAGVTMTTALVSALSRVPARQDVAMTGEITLKGRVLPIGGLKEKTMAAYRAGVKTVIIPAGNKCDLVGVDKVVKKGINFVAADDLETVLKNALTKFPH